MTAISHRRSGHHKSPGRRAVIETLENRRLLSAAPLAAVTTGTDGDGMPPVVGVGLPLVPAVAGQSYSASLAKFSSICVITIGPGGVISGGPISFPINLEQPTVTINWGDGTPSDSISSGPIGVATEFTVPGAHTYGKPGAYTITSTLNEIGEDPTVVKDSIQVDSASGGIRFNAKTGQAFNAAIGTFTAPAGQTPDHALVDWGDGTVPSDAPVVALGNSVYEVDATHTYATAGVFTIATSAAYSANDASQNSTPVATSTATVWSPGSAPTGPAAAPMPWAPSAATGTFGLVYYPAVAPSTSRARAPAGEPVTFSVASASDPSITQDIVIHWGDGSSSAMTTPASSVPPPPAVGQHNYRRPGIYAATAVIRQGGKIIRRVHERITITQTSPGGLTLHAKPGKSFSALVGTLAFADSAPIGATVDWGDGTESPGTFQGATQTGAKVSASHIYAKAGKYKITVVPYFLGNNEPGSLDPAESQIIESTIVVRR